MFHVRIRMAEGTRLNAETASLAEALLSAAQLYHDAGKWWCHLFLLMPDHCHALLVFPADGSMSATIRNWKRATARLHGVEWQENYFDHRIRDEGESAKTWTYIRRNPLVKGLCASEDDWSWWCSRTLGGEGGTRCP